jgi:phospholipase C
VEDPTDAPADGTERSSASRRDFLRRAGLGAAGLAIGGSAGAAVTAAATAHPPEFAPLAKRTTPGFDHVVVVMFENRSFDNMLGWLYSADEKSASEFNGLAQGDYSNPGPDGADIPAYVYEGSTDRIMQAPQPDPGEHFPHVNTQLFNVIDPPGNADVRANGLQPPYNTPPAGAKPNNKGFVSDFIVNFRLTKGREPTPAEYRVAMGGFSPKMMPVLSTLAREFAVYDSWHAAVPSQTFCNRLFFHASTSHGYVTNHGGDSYYKWINGPAAPTIFNRLEDAGVPWRVYYDGSQLTSLTGLLHAPSLQKYWKTNFREMAQFAIDAEQGLLPAYSFIEPRMVFNHNDMHPPWGEHVAETDVDLGGGEVLPVYSSALSDVRAGDQLVQDVYDVIRTSVSKKGSNAMNTALVITFDEHGGTYDHVAPPAAAPPDNSGPGEMGFEFDRLGLRVPTIVVSAYTARNTVIHDEMHHGSIINTLSRIHGLRPLTARDASANPIFNAINLTEPRQPYTWPQPTSNFVMPNPEETPTKSASTHKKRPLTAPAQGLTGLLLARFNPGSKVPTTYGEAFEALELYGTGLFGTYDDRPSD